MSKYVLDSSAILAFLNDEPGTERVAEALEEAVVSTVNISEVITKLIDAGIPEEQIKLVLGYLSCEIESFNLEDAWQSAKFRLITRGRGLSLGDQACLSLALKLGLPVLTADRVWSSLALEIEVQVIR
jgi:PIN domain nuclease of toxin-antitoxin system